MAVDQLELDLVMVAESSGGGRVFLRVEFGSRAWDLGEKSEPVEAEDETAMAKERRREGEREREGRERVWASEGQGEGQEEPRGRAGGRWEAG